jgi:predicted P-loop ATPase
MLATASNFIFNLDDYFAGITSRKINEFKGLLTKNTVKVRRSYARYAEELPKICSFIASSNEAQFLHDPTGNRRFLPFEVEKIDIKKAQSMDINQVWAQAFQLFKEGYIYWLEKEDQEELSEYNEQFEVQSNEYEVLVTYMRPPDENELPEADLTNAEILAHLQDKVSVKISPKKLGEALRKASFPRYQKQRNNRRSWVYGIIYADDADIYTGRQPTIPGSSSTQEE